MDITYCKDSCFKIATKNLTTTINPVGDISKLKDVVLLSSTTDSKSPEAIVFDSPGEYEVRGCMVDAIDLGDQIAGFVCTADGLRIGYIPEGVEKLDDKQAESYDSIDILILPTVGEKAEATNKLISQFEPRVVVPYNYTKEQFKLLSAEFGGESQTTERLKISSRDLTPDKQQLVALQ